MTPDARRVSGEDRAGLVWDLLREMLEGTWWETSPGKRLTGGAEGGFYISVDHTELLRKMLDESRILEPYSVLPE